MEFREVVHRRRMVRAYRPDPIPSDVLERLLAIGRQAPSAGFSQGQRFVVVSSQETRAAIAELAGEDRYAARGYPRWLSGAPIHIVVCTDPDAYRDRYAAGDKASASDPGGWDVPYWYVDAGASLMLLLLAAVDEGLAAGFIGAHRVTGLEDLLGVPDGVEVIGLVTLGRPADGQPRSNSLDRGWEPLEDIISWERWGAEPPTG